MAGSPPFFAFGTGGGILRFPVQDGQPVAITLAEYEGSCCPIIPIVCAGMPTGDCVFEISRGEYVQWAKAGTWRLNYSVTGGESFNAGADGDIFSSPPGVTADASSVLGCGFSHTFSGLAVTTTFFGPYYSGVSSGTFGVAAAINLGIVDGRYYAGATVQIDSGGSVADSNPAPTPGKEGNGVFPVSVGGYVVPMQPRLTLHYTESLGAVNTIVWTVALTRLP